MNHPHLLAINAQIDSFPPLPATVSKVMTVTADPESSAVDLMEVILPDQTMCSTILKVANSAFFGLPREVSTIERAVVVLGHEEIKNIVIGKAIFASFPKLSQKSRQTVGLFWEHAFTCGLAAKIIADHYHLSQSEFFIAGLIHDIGKLAMLTTFPEEYPILQELSSPSHFLNTGEEKTMFSISHDQVGRQLAERWMLPEQLVMAIGYHHRPQDAPCCINHALIVQVADILSLMYCCSGITKGEDVEQIFHDFLPETTSLWQAKGLDLQQADLAVWFEKLLKRRESDQAILDIFTSS